MLFRSGNCVWSGPATFKANCDLVINEWPLDSQSCELGFGSFSYGIDKMNLKLFKDTKGGGQFTSEYMRRPSFCRANCAFFDM